MEFLIYLGHLEILNSKRIKSNLFNFKDYPLNNR